MHVALVPPATAAVAARSRRAVVAGTAAGCGGLSAGRPRRGLYVVEPSGVVVLRREVNERKAVAHASFVSEDDGR